MTEKKVKSCPKCGFKCSYTRERIETFFGYRSVSDKGQPAPQSYCRECRNEKEDKSTKKKPKVKEVKKKVTTVGEVVLRKDIEKQSDELKKNIKETYKKMFPQDKSRRGYDYMKSRIERANAKTA